MGLEGVAERSSANIVASIDSSRMRGFERLLFALGIRHVGDTTARDLARAFGDIDAIIPASEDELSKVPGIGSVVASSVRQFFDRSENLSLIERLRGHRLSMTATMPRSGPLDGKIFLFTGELRSMSRQEASSMVESLGGKVASSVSKTVDFVVAGESPGSKLENAKKLNKQILSEGEFIDMAKVD